MVNTKELKWDINPFVKKTMDYISQENIEVTVINQYIGKLDVKLERNGISYNTSIPNNVSDPKRCAKMIIKLFNMHENMHKDEVMKNLKTSKKEEIISGIISFVIYALVVIGICVAICK